MSEEDQKKAWKLASTFNASAKLSANGLNAFAMNDPVIAVSTIGVDKKIIQLGNEYLLLEPIYSDDGNCSVLEYRVLKKSSDIEELKEKTR